MKTNVTVYSVSWATYDAQSDQMITRTDLYRTEEGCKHYYEQACKMLREEADTNEPEAHQVADTIDKRKYMVVRDANKPTEFQGQASYDWLTVEVEGPEIYLFDREHFTDEQARTMSRETANELAEKPKDERKVWRYCWGSTSFQQDFNAGCMDNQKYFIRFM